MADTISQLKDMDLGSDVSDLEKLGVILSQRLMLIDNAYAAQDEAVKMILQDAEKMSKEQDVLTEFRICILAAQERVHAFLAKKKEEEEMAKAQEELRKVKEQQAEQILSQMEALGLSPQALLELHQKRQNAAQQPIPSEAASAESEGPNTKKARIEEHQDYSEMVDVQVEEEEPE
jgi:DNA-nicking Smr family endonuclease